LRYSFKSEIDLSFFYNKIREYLLYSFYKGEFNYFVNFLDSVTFEFDILLNVPFLFSNCDLLILAAIRLILLDSMLSYFIFCCVWFIEFLLPEYALEWLETTEELLYRFLELLI